MAQFGSEVTSLTAPQGAGSTPVAPVQEQPVRNGLMPIVSSVVDIFHKGLVQNRKDEAEARKTAVVTAFVGEQSKVNDALVTGQITPAEAGARTRAISNKFYAGHAEYITELSEANRALQGYTEIGEATKLVETEAKRREADISQASQRGFQFVAGMPKTAEDAQIRASKAQIQSEDIMKNFYAAQGERRAQGTYDANVEAKNEKDMGFQLINTIAGSKLESSQALGATLVDQVKSGKMTPEQAQLHWNNEVSNINASIQAAARTNPELAAPFRSIFNEMGVTYSKLIEKKDLGDDEVKVLENKLKKQQLQLKLVAMGDPKFAAASITSSMLGNTPEASLAASGVAKDTIARLAQTNFSEQKYTPQVIGNPDVEKDALNITKSGLQKLQKGQVDNPEQMKLETGNVLNHLLKQTGEMINKGATPEQLKEAATFFSSPEYAYAIQNKLVSPEAAQTAYKTFQLVYEKAIMQGVQTRLEDTLKQGFYTNVPRPYVAGESTPATKNVPPKTIGEAIDAKFSGSGIVFEPKNIAGLTPVELQSRQTALAGLKTAQQGVNQLIRIAAHMEGSTDYAKVWEDNKHIWLPNVFPNPTLLKPGQVVDGYTYKGGAYSDPRSWQPTAK